MKLNEFCCSCISQMSAHFSHFIQLTDEIYLLSCSVKLCTWSVHVQVDRFQIIMCYYISKPFFFSITFISGFIVGFKLKVNDHKGGFSCR